MLKSPISVFLEKCFDFSLQNVLGEQNQNRNVLISPQRFSEIFCHMKLVFVFQSSSNEKKKNRIFQSKEKNFLMSLLKIAEHRLKEKDDFLRKILMFEKE